MAADEKRVSPEHVVRAIRRQTRRKFSADEKIRIVLEGLRGEVSIADLCRRESIHPNQYYTWSKEFLEAGKQRLKGDTERQAAVKSTTCARKTGSLSWWPPSCCWRTGC